MLKQVLISITAIALCAVGCHQARAQSDERKFEVGGQFSVLRLPTRTVIGITASESRESDPGFGGRFGYNFSKYFALEAEGNFFPRDRDIEGGRKVQGLFGAKVGKRFEKVGVFAKARPGFIRFAKGNFRDTLRCAIAIFPQPLACFEPEARTNFNVDLGGVFELYPSKNTIIRFDAGDTIIRLGARNVAAVRQPAPGSLAPTLLVGFPVAAETTHNFQGSVGFGFRF